MERFRLTFRLCCAFALLALPACARKVPPITSLDAAICAERPDLVGSQIVILESDKPATVEIDAQAPCLLSKAGARSAYRIFEIPDSSEDRVITVSSARMGETLFAPRLMLLDPSGAVTREISLESFLFHGSSLTANLRSHAGERYLIVASEPSAVGTQASRIVSTTNTSTTGGPVFITITTGQESHDRFTYAHNGSVTVVIRPVPKAN